MALVSKWALIGRYEAQSLTVHSSMFQRRQIVGQLLMMWYSNGLYALDGSAAMVHVLRWLGARVGDGCVVHFDSFSEFDLIELGSSVIVEPRTFLQAHTFEDRLFKLDKVRVGSGSFIGHGSNPLPGSFIGADVQLAPFSLILRGDTLLPATCWEGSPLQQLPQLSRSPVSVLVEVPKEKEEERKDGGGVHSSAVWVETPKDREEERKDGGVREAGGRKSAVRSQRAHLQKELIHITVEQKTSE